MKLLLKRYLPKVYRSVDLFAGYLDKPELCYIDDIGFYRIICCQRIKIRHKLTVVFVGFHIDKVNYYDTRKVSQPELQEYFFCSFFINIIKVILFILFISDRFSGINVYDRTCFRTLDYDIRA